MRFGFPLLGSRIAPRCTIADGVLFLNINGNHIFAEKRISLTGNSWMEILSALTRHRIDVFVCGGITQDEKTALWGRNITVIENIVGTTEEVIEGIAAGHINSVSGIGGILPETGESRVDCLACQDPVCLRGQQCDLDFSGTGAKRDKDVVPILEAGLDIAFEEERTLCRLSELVYFALEMNYRRIGIAYCVDLAEPARILTRVLRRFFDVIPVCCKVGGIVSNEPGEIPGGQSSSGSHTQIACNPLGQAKALQLAGSELNVAVGLCVGADCVFAKASHVPVSTLFVKDKSLANNPIGAIYSEYYLKEAAESPLVKIKASD